MPPDDSVLSLSSRAERRRRELSPSAWVVLECLATDAVDRAGKVETSVREIGRRVGLNKDTVTRAVQRLISAGLVSRLDLRDGDSGRFELSRYVVDLEAGGFESARPGSLDTVARVDRPDVIGDRSAVSGPTGRQRTAASSRSTNRKMKATSRSEADPTQLTLIDP
jgi:DNA-binding transcriptional ArsR family regulator